LKKVKYYKKKNGIYNQKLITWKWIYIISLWWQLNFNFQVLILCSTHVVANIKIKLNRPYLQSIKVAHNKRQYYTLMQQKYKKTDNKLKKTYWYFERMAIDRESYRLYKKRKTVLFKRRKLGVTHSNLPSNRWYITNCLIYESKIDCSVSTFIEYACYFPYYYIKR